MLVALARFAVIAALGGCAGVIDEDSADGGGDGSGDPANPPRSVDIEGPAVLPHVQLFANTVCGATDACTISTYTGHHPSAARALDILVSDAYGMRSSDGNALGDRVAAYALAHQAEHGIWYVIFAQRYNDGGGWDPMEDRGSITQNHHDHVHVSFDEAAPAMVAPADEHMQSADVADLIDR